MNYKCNCGWIGHTPKKKSKNKVQSLVCPECTEVVQKYEIPLTDRVGRCSACGNGGFELKILNHDFIRICKECKTEKNIK